MPDSPEWLSWERFESIQVRTLRRFDHFIVDPGISSEVFSDSVRSMGRLICQGRFEIAVYELLVLRFERARPQVARTQYSFQLLRRPTDRPVEKVIRYDNIHAHPGHPDAHHVHRGERIEHVGAANRPTLADVSAEAEALWRSER